MRTSANTGAKTCEYCGKPLKRTVVELFGRRREVACYGSCGCQRSRERLESFGPTVRASEATPHRCPLCGGTMRLDLFTGRVSDCPWCGYSCAFASDLEAWRETLGMERRMAEGGVLAGTGVPRLYWDVAPNHDLANRIEETGKGFYIYGANNGTYKTLTASAIAKAYAERGRSVRFMSSTAMMQDFKATFGTSKTESDITRELAGCDLLVIDDMGKEQATSWSATMLYTVIDARYGSRNPPPPMVVTTNFEEDELLARMAESSDRSTAKATVSRIYEMTEKLVMNGPDRRLG